MLSLAALLLRVVCLSCVEDGAASELLVQPLVSYHFIRSIGRLRITKVVKSLVLLFEIELFQIHMLTVTRMINTHFHISSGHVIFAGSKRVCVKWSFGSLWVKYCANPYNHRLIHLFHSRIIL